YRLLANTPSSTSTRGQAKVRRTSVRHERATITAERGKLATRCRTAGHQRSLGLPDRGQESQSASATASAGRNTSTQATDPRIRPARMRMKSCTTAPATTARVSFLFQSSRNAKYSIGTRQSVEL